MKAALDDYERPSYSLAEYLAEFRASEDCTTEMNKAGKKQGKDGIHISINDVAAIFRADKKKQPLLVIKKDAFNGYAVATLAPI